jgi:bifunctional non-homologous end joining protein LigD
VSTLAKYRQMRDFAKTREPRGAAGKRLPRAAAALSFVVQKHDARNLHFDFRLELDGALLSWAVPKGPSLDPTVKRLAMQVEPHPLEYGGFEGTIPKGEYGGGTVMVWDRGTWSPEGDPHAGLAKGHLRFSLQGERLKGAWHLVRSRGKADDGHGNKESQPWLLFKSRDAEASEADTLLKDNPNSVVTGRSFEEIATEVGESEAAPDSQKRRRKRSKRAPAAVKLPATLAPELATLVDAAPEGDDWVHEIKFDGYRVLARIVNGEVTLLTRNGKDWSARMPSLRRALEELDAGAAILDGELVALNDKGVSDFQTLQNSLKEGEDEALVYYAFDLPFGPDGDLRDRPLVERKSLLRELLEKNEKQLAGRVRFSAHVVGSGPEFFANAGKLGLEGTIAKRASSPYQSGRGRDWLKIKCGQRQEFTVVGYTQPGGSRTRFGALLVGTQRDGQLVYAGRVGTGFSQASLDDLHARLQPLAVESPPVVNPPRGADARGVQWVKPELVAEVSFTEMTQEGLLRHPSFQGLREDKPAQEVNMETAVSIESRAVSTRKFPITNPTKVLFPAQGITKQELLEYYAVVAKRMLPHVKNRPLTLVRCPNGYGKPCFFQKHPGNTAVAGLREIPIREKEGKSSYSALDDAQGLFALVQLGALEIHTWGSRADDFEHPDTLVFDLDPDPSVDYTAVIAGAHAVREVFEHAGLETFVKTTGGKGLHVCVPIRPDLSWDEAKDFTSRVAHAIAERSPGLYVATQSKAKRKGKTFIDYLRNGRGATFIAPYSTRAREGAPIAVPLEWDELSPKLPPDHFNLRNIKKRLSILKKDPFERMSQLAPRLVPERTKP